MASGMTGPPRWLYFILSVCSLMASGIHLGLAVTAGFSAGRILRVVVFGLLGMLWVLMYGAGGRHRVRRDHQHLRNDAEKNPL